MRSITVNRQFAQSTPHSEPSHSLSQSLTLRRVAFEVTTLQAVNLHQRCLKGPAIESDKSAAAARAIVLAEAGGLAEHGLLQLPIYIDRTCAGGYPTDASLDVVLDTGPLLTMNGCRGLRHWQLASASQEAISRGTRFVVTASPSPTRPLRALGIYTADIPAADLVGLVFSCGPAVFLHGERPRGSCRRRHWPSSTRF